MHRFETGQTVVRRDVHGSGRVWSEHALRVVADTSEALVAACPPGAETRWPALYVKARDDGDRSVRTEAFDAMATGVWELADAVWQETELLVWKPPAAWFSVNAFYTGAGLRNWYVNFEHPTRRTGGRRCDRRREPGGSDTSRSAGHPGWAGLSSPDAAARSRPGGPAGAAAEVGGPVCGPRPQLPLVRFIVLGWRLGGRVAPAALPAAPR